MSQLVACHTPRCLLLAADRRVVAQVDGEEQIHTAQKLFPLGSTAAVATSGAAVGIDASRELARLLAAQSPSTFEQVEARSLSVIGQRYDAFCHRGKAWFDDHPEALRLSYILLGGFDGDPSADRRIFRFYGSESHDEPHRHINTAEVLTAPRRLGLELRLSRAAQADAEPDALRELVIEGLRLSEKREQSVRGPFDRALFDAAGRHLYSVDSL